MHALSFQFENGNRGKLLLRKRVAYEQRNSTRGESDRKEEGGEIKSHREDHPLQVTGDDTG